MAETAEEGLALARDEQPDLILLDIYLPDENGLLVCRKIKNDPLLEQSMVVIISGVKTAPHEQADGLDAGADEYMAKPLNKSEVLARIESLLRIKRVEEALRASESRYRSLFDSLLNGFALHQLIRDRQGNPSDFRYLDLNPGFETHTGLKKDDLLGRTILEIFPHIETELLQRFFAVIQTGQADHFEAYVHELDKYMEIMAYQSEPELLAMVFQDITKRKSSEREIKLAKIQWERTFNTISDPIMLMDTNYQIKLGNEALYREVGLSADEVLGRQCFSIMCPFETAIADCPYQQALEDKQEYSRSIYNEHLGGNILVKVNPMLDEQDQVVGAVHVTRDINDLEEAKRLLQEKSDQFERVFQGTQDALFLIEVIDSQTFKFIRTNQSHQNATGFSLEDVQGKTPQQLLGEETGALVSANYARCVSAQKPISYEEILNLPAGKRTWYTTLTPIFQEGRIVFLVGSSQDITERKQMEQSLRFWATTDELTGLWNRRYFMRAVSQEIQKAHRYMQFFSLLMLDIDHFKHINDRYGHGAGDRVLAQLGYVLRENLRQVDIPGRFGGEEFAIILPQTNLNGAYLIAERLRQYFETNALSYENSEISFTVSIGAAEYQLGLGEDEIIKMADDALYEAKAKGRNCTVLKEMFSDS
jgi:diguanylate cyclase (GGDEF)-like protein/PAS domain S-box-containing protein